MSAVVVGVGSNLGAREVAIRAARGLLDARPGIAVVRVSPTYETEPLGPPQGRYLNAALRLETSLLPTEVLHALLRTERRLGRKRSAAERWGPRSVDLDLLWDARGPYESPGLCVPHPELTQRDFALAPLLDVAPELDGLYGPALEALGGRPAPWDRDGIVRTRTTDRGVEIEAEADSLPDACALCASAPRPAQRIWSTRHVAVTPSPDGFARALRELFRTGFSVHCATLSHCSKSQWIAQFHGVNTGMPVEADVRLQTTSGTYRKVRAQLSINPAVA